MDQRCGEREMPLAAEDDLGGFDQATRRGCQALESVLADADDCQPPARRGIVRGDRIRGRHGATHPHSRRHDGGAASRRTARVARRSRRDGVARWAHRVRSSTTACRCGSAGSAASRGLWPGSRRRGSTSSSMRPTRLPTRCRGTRSPPRSKPACGFLRFAGRRGLRSRATAGPRSTAIREAVAALGSARRRVFLALGRQEIDAFARAPQHFYLVRSIDKVTDRFLAEAVYVEARGPFREDDERALMSEHDDRHGGGKEQRRRRRLRARSPRRGRSAPR